MLLRLAGLMIAGLAMVDPAFAQDGSILTELQLEVRDGIKGWAGKKITFRVLKMKVIFFLKTKKTLFLEEWGGASSPLEAEEYNLLE